MHLCVRLLEPAEGIRTLIIRHRRIFERKKPSWPYLQNPPTTWRSYLPQAARFHRQKLVELLTALKLATPKLNPPLLSLPSMNFSSGRYCADCSLVWDFANASRLVPLPLGLAGSHYKHDVFAVFSWRTARMILSTVQCDCQLRLQRSWLLR